MGGKSNSTSMPLGVNWQRKENTLSRRQLAQPSQDRGDAGGCVEGATTTVSLKWEAAWFAAIGSQSSDVRLGCSVELSTHLSACKWCFRPCLVSWLDNSAHHRERLPCLLWKSVVRQQAPCSYLPTTLCIDKDVVSKAGYSKNAPHSLTRCISDLAFSNNTAVFVSPTLSQETP